MVTMGSPGARLIVLTYSLAQFLNTTHSLTRAGSPASGPIHGA